MTTYTCTFADYCLAVVIGVSLAMTFVCWLS